VLGRVRAEIVVDLATGRVLHEADADAPARPASLAKLMTLEMLFAAMEAGVVDEATPIPVSARAAAMPPTRLGLPAGSSIPAREAALCLAVHSCNDVAAAVAEHLAGNEERFAAAMTEAARRLGLRATTFGNASGLPDPRNRSTARELALLGAGIVTRHPRLWGVLGTARWGYGEASFRNTSRLIGAHPLIHAGKTGFIRESGNNMLALAAAPDGRRVLVVVLGGTTAGERDARVLALVEAGIAAAAVPVPVPRHAGLSAARRPAAGDPG
jgi:D-alanyl-D-alanine carboxypeptidase